jgi:hypothetical protein
VHLKAREHGACIHVLPQLVTNYQRLELARHAQVAHALELLMQATKAPVSVGI